MRYREKKTLFTDKNVYVGTYYTGYKYLIWLSKLVYKYVLYYYRIIWLCLS